MAKKRRPRRRKAQRESGKGTLIKGMSRRLPSELLEDRLFRERLKQIMRRQAGIYALYDGDTPYYTGLTVNLFGRLGRHLRDKHAGRWTHFVIFRIKKVGYLKDIEVGLPNCRRDMLSVEPFVREFVTNRRTSAAFKCRRIHTSNQQHLRDDDGIVCVPRIGATQVMWQLRRASS